MLSVSSLRTTTPPLPPVSLCTLHARTPWLSLWWSLLRINGCLCLLRGCRVAAVCRRVGISTTDRTTPHRDTIPVGLSVSLSSLSMEGDCILEGFYLVGLVLTVKINWGICLMSDKPKTIISHGILTKTNVVSIARAITIKIPKNPLNRLIITFLPF